jgi:hypothetical protein
MPDAESAQFVHRPGPHDKVALGLGYCKVPIFSTDGTRTLCLGTEQGWKAAVKTQSESNHTMALISRSVTAPSGNAGLDPL